MADGILVDQGLLNQVARDVRSAMAGINTVNAMVVNVRSELKSTQERVHKLRLFVEDMRREQRNAAALQNALTEIIRVRQELEQKFGKYQLVRDTMIGILGATDAALVTKDTISRVSEELMVGTPNYWLAPCVVALAAWIANDRDLANRAIEEALSRDEQKTALLMALICRRNERSETSKKWLTYYFECQSATNISRSVLLFVNAYANGIFDKKGEQGDNQSDDFIENKWLPELKAESKKQGRDFEAEQKAYWNTKFCEQANQNQSQVVGTYKVLSKYAIIQDFKSAIEYLSRINAAERIAADLSAIIDYRIDPSIIVAQLDEYLKSLVTDFDEVEFSLREEEAEYTAIKEAKGDVDVARRKINLKKEKKARLAQKVSLIEFLNATISGTRVDEVAEDRSGKSKEELAKMAADQAAEFKAEQKVALKFTRSYVQDSYDTFMEEKRPSYPKQMRVRIEDVEHSIKSEADKKPFIDKVTDKLSRQRDEAVKAVKPTMVILGIVALVLGLIFLAAVNPAFGVIVLIAGGVVAIVGFNNFKKQKATLITTYNTRIDEAAKLINRAVDEWLAMNRVVAAFEQAQKFDIKHMI